MTHQKQAIQSCIVKIISDNHNGSDSEPTLNDWLDSIRVLQTAAESIRIPGLKQKLNAILKSDELMLLAEYEEYDGSDPMLIQMNEQQRDKALEKAGGLKQ